MTLMINQHGKKTGTAIIVQVQNLTWPNILKYGYSAMKWPI